MPEQDPIEQRIAGIEAALERCGKTYGKAWTYRRFYDEIPWLIAQLREALAALRTITDHYVVLQKALFIAHGKALPANWVYVDPQTTIDLMIAEITTTRYERDLAIQERDEAQRETVAARQNAAIEIGGLLGQLQRLRDDASMSARKAEPDVLE